MSRSLFAVLQLGHSRIHSLVMKLPRLFFDTNVLEPLATPPLNTSFEKIRKHLSRKYNYVVSPLTADELLLGIKGGDEQFFGKDQQKMIVLRGLGQNRLLPHPATFALKTVLGTNVSSLGSSIVEVKNSIAAVIRAKSKMQLEQGLVPMQHSRKTCGLNFEPIEQRHAWGKAEHARILESLRSKQVRRPSPDEWAKNSFLHFILHLPDADWSKLATAIEAAFTFNGFLCDQAERDGYDFASHNSDWIDIHQLFYLADPSIHFLTRDKALHNRVNSCGSASRIILFDDLMNELGV